MTLTKRDLLDMLEAAGGETTAGPADQEQLMDLSVSEIMEATGRARSTVIGWINSGELQSYMFGRERRVTRAAWNDFLRRRRGEGPTPGVEAEAVDIGSWRSLAAGGGG